MEKLKADGGYEAYKQKRAASEKSRRERLKAGLDKLPKTEREKLKTLNRTYMRKKVAEYRQRKKGLPATSVTTAPTTPATESEIGYKTKSARYKAVGKIKRSLPSTTVKKVEAVSDLLGGFDVNLRNSILANVTGKPKSRPTRALKSSIIESVIEFYQRDDISRMSPNVKDCRKFVNSMTGEKEEKQLRYLIYKLSDVYEMFLRHIRNGKISTSTLRAVRPSTFRIFQ